jgi:hypothetical protein
MRRGCTSLGDVQCDECQRQIPYPERYMVIDEEGTLSRICVNCCLSKGYARYTEDKGQQVLTFFPERAESLQENQND